MKPDSFIFAVVADQIRSRSGTDAVPAALGELGKLDLLLPFERTAGDEIQALATSAHQVVSAIATLTRLSGWRVGVGFGTVEQPLPTSTREARGPAYLAARAAITDARRAPQSFALRLADTVSDERYGDLQQASTAAETALWLWRSILARRSQEGWELMDVLDAGHTGSQAAGLLGISPSAVSQRLSAAAREEGQRGAQLCEYLLTALQTLTVTPA